MHKLPDGAQQVFKGVIFEVYQWQQKMFDGTTETFEAIKRPATTEIVATQNGKILIAEEEQPGKGSYLTLLGGRVEEGEEPQANAKRELLEEAGCETENWELYKTYEAGGKIIWQNHIYVARNCSKVSSQRLDSGERILIRTITFKEFLDLLTTNKILVHKDFIIEMLQLQQNPQKLKTFKDHLFE